MHYLYVLFFKKNNWLPSPNLTLVPEIQKFYSQDTSIFLISQHHISFLFLKNNFTYLLIFGCTGSLMLCGLSLVVSGSFSCHSTGSRTQASVVVQQEPRCATTYGIAPDEGSNPCLLHWQADSFFFFFNL